MERRSQFGSYYTLLWGPFISFGAQLPLFGVHAQRQKQSYKRVLLSWCEHVPRGQCKLCACLAGACRGVKTVKSLSAKLRAAAQVASREVSRRMLQSSVFLVIFSQNGISGSSFRRKQEHGLFRAENCVRHNLLKVKNPARPEIRDSYLVPQTVVQNIAVGDDSGYDGDGGVRQSMCARPTYRQLQYRVPQLYSWYIFKMHSSGEMEDEFSSKLILQAVCDTPIACIAGCVSSLRT